MRKRIRVTLMVIVILGAATPAFAEWELGLSLFPASQGTLPAQPSGNIDWMVGFHLGHNFWKIAYLSWDAISLPDFMTQDLSMGAYNVPSFLNLYDTGVRLVGGPLLAFAEIGLNNMWIYDVGLQPLADMGANMRAGFGVRSRWWGVTVSATEVFPRVSDLSSTFGGMWSMDPGTRSGALAAMRNGLIWSVGLTLYMW